MDLALQRLVDRADVSETITRYFTALDHRDWVEMRATLAGTIDLDFSELFGDPRAVLDSDGFVEFARAVLTGFRATQHISPNHLVHVDGDRAECQAYMYAWHTVPPIEPGAEDTFTLRGHYVAGLVRAEDGWRMDKLHMGVWDEAGDKGLYAVARARFDAAEAEALRTA